jgi:hypothetical protein
MTTALAALVGVLCIASAAWAIPQRVAVLKPDAELLRAISLALSPWGIETIASDAPLPTSSQPQAVRHAAGLSRQLRVEALVWMTQLEQGSLLWVFDVDTGDVTTRLLPERPPLDGAAAAAVALSVKTVLRSSVIAPPAERFGLQSSPPPQVEPPATVAPEPVARIAALEIGGGATWIGETRLDSRLQLAGVLWLPALDRLGVSLELATGPGLAIDRVDYRGRYREVIAGGKVRWRVVDLSSFATTLALGGAAHWAVLDGTLEPDGRQSDASRVNGSVDFESRVDFDLSDRFYLGLAIGAAYSPTIRRYLVQGEPVLSPQALTFNLNGHCGVRLF